jgi:hypothetical protein
VPVNTRIILSFALALAVPCLCQAQSKSTIEDQSAVEVTVYNSNIGLVKDTRTIDVSKGEGQLRFMDVAASIIPETVHIKALGKNPLSVIEQNYEYDLINETKLLDKYVGKKIKLIKENQFNGQKETVEATLLSNNNGQVYQIGNEIYLGFPGQRILPEIPDNLIAKPTLSWEYDASISGKQPIEVSYLTNNINWKADYVLSLDEADKSAGLSGWVTLNNQSGAMYRNAKLKLVAGDINRVQPEMASTRMKANFALAQEVSAPRGFVEQSFFEYHIYDLQHPTTIKENQTKQVLLLEAENIKTDKEFVVDGNPNFFYQVYRNQDYKVPVEVYISFKNSKENNLGMPLPGGIMRLYKTDSSKSLQFIGEDNIQHTPKDEKVRLKIGKAFDIVAERKQTDFKMIATNVYESSWEVKIRNHKKEDVKVAVFEPLAFFGEWEVLSSSIPYEKEDVSTIRFDVPVVKDEETVLTYRIRVKYGY